MAYIIWKQFDFFKMVIIFLRAINLRVSQCLEQSTCFCAHSRASIAMETG